MASTDETLDQFVNETYNKIEDVDVEQQTFFALPERDEPVPVAKASTKRGGEPKMIAADFKLDDDGSTSIYSIKGEKNIQPVEDFQDMMF